MEFRILGPLEVLENGRRLELGGAKQRALLAVLLLHANEVVSTDRLIDALWEEDAPETGRKALQVYVSQLRKALGKERIATRSPGYRLGVEPDELDLARFQAPPRRGPSRRGALLVARPAARGLRLRALRSERDRASRGSAPCLSRGPNRGRPRPRAAMPRWSASWRPSSASTRCASAYAASICSRCIARDGRRKRSRRIRTHAARSSRSSGSTRRASSASSSRRSCARILRSTPRAVEQVARPPRLNATEPSLVVRADAGRSRRAKDGHGPARAARGRTEHGQELDPEVLRRAADPCVRGGHARGRGSRRHDRDDHGRRGDRRLRSSRSSTRTIPSAPRRAADEIQRRLADSDGAARLAVRIGVSTGPVYTGGAPTGRQLRATGEPLTTSARLALEARAGRDGARRRDTQVHRCSRARA